MDSSAQRRLMGDGSTQRRLMDGSTRVRLRDRRGTRKIKRRTSSTVAVVIMFLSLVVIFAVATIRPNLVGTPGGIRRHDTEQQEAQPVQRKLQVEGAHFRGNSVSSSDEEEGAAAAAAGGDDDDMEIRAPQDNSYIHSDSEAGGSNSGTVLAASEASAEPVPVEEALPVEPEEVSEEVSGKENVEILYGEGPVAEDEVKVEESAVAHEQAVVAVVAVEEPAVEQENHQKLGVNFCQVSNKNRNPISSTNPAVIILGSEDTSTDFIWHAISHILHPTKTSKAKLGQNHATRIEYQALAKVDGEAQRNFWDNISVQSHGKWLPHVFCQQQQHGLPIGFPWTANVEGLFSEKAKETLQMAKSLPEGSVKIIRVRRNYLDVLTRKIQTEPASSVGEQIKINTKQLLSKLQKVQHQQDEIDNWLKQNDIPHTEIDFETLLPFENWRDMVQVSLTAQQNPFPLNGSGKMLFSSNMEKSWRHLLTALEIQEPHSLYDILQAAMQTHKTSTFWSQQDVLENYKKIEVALRGTKYQRALRKNSISMNAIKPANGWDEV
jgi:hypothetical protein